MDREQAKLIERLTKIVEKAEREAKTPSQLMMEGLAEIREQKEAQEKKEVDKYLSTSYENATPLQKGSARQRVLEDRLEVRRIELGEEMEKLKESKDRRKNWLNQDID